MSGAVFQRLVAFRYSRPYLRRGMTGFLSFVSLVGLAVAVFTLIVVMSVMNGFERELQNRMLSLLPDARVHQQMERDDWQAAAESWQAQPGILAAAPYIEGAVLLNANRAVAKVALLGIDPIQEQKISSLTDHMVAGDINTLNQQSYNIVMGSFLARQLGLAIGDRVNLIVPRVYFTPLGPITRQKQFTLTGVFEVGAELDQSLALTSLRSSGMLLGKKAQVDGLRLSVAEQFSAAAIVSGAANRLIEQGVVPANIRWSDWRQQHSALYNAVVMEKIMIFVLLLAVVAVASFNVISIILMTVTDKKTDIAVLRTMGASARQIRQLFIMQGLTIGTAGTLGGAILGVLVAPNVGALLAFIERQLGWQLFDPTVYYIPYLPSLLNPADVLVVVAAGILISLLVTLFPALRASRINPVVALSASF